MIEYNYDLIYNPIYSPSTPLFFALASVGPTSPAIGIIGGENTNLAATYDLQSLGQVGILNIENYQLGTKSDTSLDIKVYQSLGKITGTDFDLMIANHNAVNESLQNVIGDPTANSCKAVARIGTKEFKAWAENACKTTPGKARGAFCSLSVALQTQIGTKSTEAIIYAGCKITVKLVKEGSKELVDIYLDWQKELDKSIEEIKFWLSFINSTEGMMWLYNEVGRL